MDTTCLVRTLDACVSFLGSADGDWSAQIPEMDWTVAQSVAHIAEGLLWYATDFAAGTTELTSMDLSLKVNTSAADLVRTVSSFGTVLVRTLTSASIDARGWHPYGISDASGFAAMGCDELLVHTHDAARGLGVPFAPDASLAAATLARLFPEAPGGFAPWQTLLWANGRAALPGHARRSTWRWTLASEA